MNMLLPRGRRRAAVFEPLEPRQLLSGSPIPAAADGDFDDQIGEALDLGAITAPRVLQDAISNPIDVDLYRFTATAGQRIGFDIDLPAGGLDSYLRLFNAAGVEIAWNDDGAGPDEFSSFESFLNHSFAAAGTYYLGVSSFGNSSYDPVVGAGDFDGSTGAYTLTVTLAAEDEDDQISEAIDLGQLTDVREVQQAIDRDTDVDMFRFTVGAGQRVTFDIDRPSGVLDSYLRLFNANGVQLASNDDAAGPGEGGTFESYLDHTFAAGGTYYLGVSGYGNSIYHAVNGTGDGNGSTGAYSLVVSPVAAVADDAYEENDTFHQARNLGVRVTRRGYYGLRLVDGNDWYRFTITDAGNVNDYVRINFNSALGDLELELYNRSRQLVGRSNSMSHGEQISLSGMPTGQYFIRVYGYAGAQNQYNLIIEPAGAAPSAGIDDAYENNDTRATARNLGVLPAARTISNLVMADASDWYRFQTRGVGTADDFVRIDFSDARGDLDLELYDAAGRLINRSIGVSDFERIPLQRLAGGVYYVRVFGYAGATNPSYSLTIDPPDQSAPPVLLDDDHEENDTRATASDLGTRNQPLTLNNLVMADASDFYRFTTTSAGTASDFVRITFDQARGDLDLALMNANGRVLRSSLSSSGGEEISLQGLPAGAYVVRVYGYNGARNPGYSLTVSPPSADPAPTPAGRNVLYVNFDGINISNNQLRTWAGSDWQGSVGDYLDPEGDGILVARFMPTRGDRNQIINGIIARLQADLRPFGVTVQRVTSGAVMNRGATTLFFGNHNMRDVPHVASDVDFGNDNRTDIAFIKDENWGSAADTITALADVALHEAGHTFGLFHVNVVQNGTIFDESMGLRYSTDQGEWLRDTSFLNRSFTEYLNHGGGRGTQNTFQTMRRNFGLAPGNPTLAKAKASYKDVRLTLLACIERDHDHDHDHDAHGREAEVVDVLDEVVRRGRELADGASARRGRA